MSAIESPLFDVAAVRALRPLRRTGRLARFRILDVACPRNHRLAQVFRTAAGNVVVGIGPVIHVTGGKIEGGEAYDDEYGWYSWEHEPEERRLSSREGTLCYFVEKLASGRGANVTVQCRCSLRTLRGLWLAARIADGRRRAVIEE